MRIKKILKIVILPLLIVFLDLNGKVFAEDTPQEAANKQTVLDFYAMLDQADKNGNISEVIDQIAETYIAEDYIQNNPRYVNQGMDGREGFVQIFKGAGERPLDSAFPRKPELIAIIGRR